MTATYWIAQHVSDVFRNEPKNVGVVVQTGANVAARFFAETSPGQIDKRRLRGWQYPDVYVQWVEYWRDELNYGRLEEVIAASSSNYRVLSGGEVTDIEADSAADIATYLYALLVSEGGFAEALGQEEIETAVVRSLRVMTQLELNVVNAAKRVIAAEDDGTLAGERKYAGAYARLVAAVSALTTAEHRERRERARERARVQRERKRARAEASHGRL